MRKELFDVEIKTPHYKVHEVGIAKDVAIELVERTLADHPDDELLKHHIYICKQSFGFIGSCGDGYDVNISGYVPILKTGEKQTCPDRMQSFGSQEKIEGLDEWEMRGSDKCCSYCGSIHPDRLLTLIKEHGFDIIQKTDKQYKWYVNRPNVHNASYGGIKYYRWHDTVGFIDEYNELVTNHKNKKSSQ